MVFLYGKLILPIFLFNGYVLRMCTVFFIDFVFIEENVVLFRNCFFYFKFINNDFGIAFS